MENQPEQVEEQKDFAYIYKKFIYPSLPKTKKELVWLVIIVLVVISLCMFTFNQFVSVKYKAELIQNACWNCEHQGNRCTLFNPVINQSSDYPLKVVNINLSGIT